MNSEFDELYLKVVEWAEHRGLTKESTPMAQFLKLGEEYNELGYAIYIENASELVDAIGDMMVVLTVICELTGVSLVDCYRMAYEEIKGRQGIVKDGIFIKE